MKVGTAELAAVIGLTERRVQQLETQGVLQKDGHGAWDLAACVQAYLRHRLRAKRVPAPRAAAEEKLKAAKAAREELRLQRERGQVIDADEALAILDEIVGMLRADLAGVPARLTREMTWRTRIETEIDAALGRVADRFAARADDLRARGDAVPAADADDAGPLGGAEP